MQSVNRPRVTLIDRGEREPSWRSGCATLIGMLLIGFMIGFIIGNASRPAPATTPQGGSADQRDTRASGTRMTSWTTALAAPPVPSTSPEQTTTRSGKASYVGSEYGSRYLALPEGPGHSVTICAGARCIQRVSTDAGPDKAMQRAGRVADLSRSDFAYLCGCHPEDTGLIHVSVSYGPAATLPPTDTEE